MAFWRCLIGVLVQPPPTEPIGVLGGRIIRKTGRTQPLAGRVKRERIYDHVRTHSHNFSFAGEMPNTDRSIVSRDQDRAVVRRECDISYASPAGTKSLELRRRLGQIDQVEVMLECRYS